MIAQQEGIRTITSSEADDNEIGDYVLVRFDLTTTMRITIVAGWLLLGSTVVAATKRTDGYIDCVYRFEGAP